MEDQAAEIEALKEELKWAKAKIVAQQIDLGRWAQKNQQSAKGTVDSIMDYPRAKTWKLYQEGLLQSDHLSDLNQEADRQESERNRWLE